MLRGKSKPIFTPHVDCGDYAIIINADKIAITDKKLGQRVYYSHFLYAGSMKGTTLRELKAKKSEKATGNTVKGILPKEPLGTQMYRELYVYVGENRSYQA